MSVNTPNPGIYFQQLGQDLVNLRIALDALIRDAAYLNAMGGAAFLEAAPFNLSATDAVAVAGAIGAVTPTNAAVVAIQAFLTSAIPLTGGN